MSKAPHPVLESIYAFPPNRETLGGTAYLIVGNPSTILIDCPPWTPSTQEFIAAQGSIDWFVITHRGGIGDSINEIQTALDCPVAIQEQEAYLLPNLPVTSFQDTLPLDEECHMLWTPGHSPGSACVYLNRLGGCLFTGRHLLPHANGEFGPVKTSTTFHWPRQLRSIQELHQAFSADTLAYILPGAHGGFLRGKGVIADAYAQLVHSTAVLS